MSALGQLVIFMKGYIFREEELCQFSEANPIFKKTHYETEDCHAMYF